MAAIPGSGREKLDLASESLILSSSPSHTPPFPLCICTVMILRLLGPQNCNPHHLFPNRMVEILFHIKHHLIHYSSGSRSSDKRVRQDQGRSGEQGPTSSSLLIRFLFVASFGSRGGRDLISVSAASLSRWICESSRTGVRETGLAGCPYSFVISPSLMLHVKFPCACECVIFQGQNRYSIRQAGNKRQRLGS